MISRPFRTVLLVLFVLASATGIVAVRADNARWRKRIAEARRQSEQVRRLREDNQSLRRLMKRVEADEGDGDHAIHADVVRARAEVSALETRAQETRAQTKAQAVKDAAGLAGNRDPEKGMTRLEYFQNVGQATPGAAFQTFVWGSLKGEDDKLASMITFSEAERKKAEAVVADLPEEARKKYPTPERLAVLYFALVLPEFPSAEIAGVDFQDSQHATVSVRGLSEKTDRIQMQLSAQGWRVVVPAGITERLGRLAAGGLPAEKK